MSPRFKQIWITKRGKNVMKFHEFPLILLPIILCLKFYFHANNPFIYFTTLPFHQFIQVRIHIGWMKWKKWWDLSHPFPLSLSLSLLLFFSIEFRWLFSFRYLWTLPGIFPIFFLFREIANFFSRSEFFFEFFFRRNFE